MPLCANELKMVRIFEDENAWHAQVRQISVANKISEEFVVPRFHTNKNIPPHHLQKRLFTMDSTVVVKLVLLGDTAVGKSCLVVRFVRDEFFEFQEPTIGGRYFRR